MNQWKQRQLFQYKHRDRFLFIAILVILINYLMVFSVQAQEQNIFIWSASLDATSVRSQDEDRLKEELHIAISQAIPLRPEWLLPGGDDFELNFYRSDGQYALITIARQNIPIEGSHVTVPDVLFAAGSKESDGWRISLEGEPGYAEQLAQIPESLLDNETRSSLITAQPKPLDVIRKTMNRTYSIPGLPWKAGETWRYSQQIHGSLNHAMDLATSNGQSKEVYTVDQGVVSWANDTCMAFKRNDGLYHAYQHINKSDIAYWAARIGTSVSYQSRIGMTTTLDGCSGNSSGHHVHFWIYDVYTTQTNFQPIGSTFNGWTLHQVTDTGEADGKAEIFVKGGQTICDDGVVTQNGQNVCSSRNLYFESSYNPSPRYKGTYVQQQIPSAPVSTGEMFEVWFEYKNTGSETWTKNVVKLGTEVPRDRDSIFYTASAFGWQRANRISMEQDSVAPGETGRFKAIFTAPNTIGTYREEFRLVAEGVGWFEDSATVWFSVDVQQASSPTPLPTAPPPGSGNIDYVYEVEDAPICGPEGKIALEIDSSSNGRISLEVTKCEGGDFQQGGTASVVIDGALYGEFSYDADHRVIDLKIYPSDTRKHDYQVKVRSSGDGQYKHTGTIKAWGIDTNVGSSYIYSVNDDDFICGPGAEDDIQLRIRPRNGGAQPYLDARVGKCDGNSFIRGGRFWIERNQNEMYGPFYVGPGDRYADVEFDPVGGSNITGAHDYRIRLEPKAESGNEGDFQGEYMYSGTVRAWNDDCYQLTTEASPYGWGTVSHSSGDCGNSSFSEGTQVTVRANPNSGYVFDRWSNDANGSSPTTVVTMSRDKTIKANFQEKCYALTIQNSPNIGGDAVAATTPNCNGDQYESGTVVTISAYPNTGYVFSQWSGSTTGANSSTTITMNSDQSVTANFKQACYTLNLAQSTGGTIASTTTPNCEGDKYLSGTTVSLTATPENDYQFISWLENLDGTTSLASLLMNSNKSVGARFTQLRQDINLSVSLLFTGRTLWNLPLEIALTPSGSTTPLHTESITTDSAGHFTLQLSSLAVGEYALTIKAQGMLRGTSIISLVEGTNDITFDELRAGDVNNDNIVNLNDFRELVDAYGTSSGQPSYNESADFNGDGQVGLNDFRMLVSSYGQFGDSISP